MLTDMFLTGQGQSELIRSFEQKFKKLTGKVCSVLVRSKLDDLLRKMSTKEILDVVETYNLPTMPPLRSASRKRELVNLRKIYCMLAKRAGYKLSTIGEELGERDHTTVIHSIKEGNNHLEKEPEFQYLYQVIEEKILFLYESRLEADQPVGDQSQQSLSVVLY